MPRLQELGQVEEERAEEGREEVREDPHPGVSLQYKICRALINDNVILCFLLALVQLLCDCSVLPHDHCWRLQSTALLHAVILIPYNSTPSLVMSQHCTDDNSTWSNKSGHRQVKRW